jgi:hypothetical protein
MTSKEIDFAKPIQATLASGGTLNFNLNTEIPGQAQIALALQAIADAHASQQSSYSDLKKFDSLAPGGGIDRSKLKSHGMTIGNY